MTNLYDALLVTRQYAEVPQFSFAEVGGKTLAKYLWIDAVCINQDDTDERSSQVPSHGQYIQPASNRLCMAWKEGRSVGGSL
jgi:Heterokaryon incompatibility protein (HET)